MSQLYKYINSLEVEGFCFVLLSRYVECFYKNVMKAKPIKNQGLSVLIHHTRDFEYPWVLKQSKIKPKEKVLDCGAGFSPVTFILSKLGAEVTAVDKETKICSRTFFAFLGLRKIMIDLLRAPILASSRIKLSSYQKTNFNMRDGLANSSNSKKSFFYCYFTNLKTHFSRALRPDVWGPIPPSLIKEYKINYLTGSKGDFTKLCFEDKYFDVVTCISVLEHMTYEDMIKGVKEMSRVLKNGGKLIITYDLTGKDLTDELVKTSGLKPIELIYYKGSKYRDVIGIVLIKK